MTFTTSIVEVFALESFLKFSPFQTNNILQIIF